MSEHTPEHHDSHGGGHGLTAMFKSKKGKTFLLIAGVVVGGILLWLYIQNRGSSSVDSSDDTEDTSGDLPEVSGDDLTGSGDTSGDSGSQPINITVTPTGGGKSASTAKTLQTTKNLSTGGVRTTAGGLSAWEQNAIGYLTSHGVEASKAENAISAYAGGEKSGHVKLSYHQNLLFNRAVKAVGAAPGKAVSVGVAPKQTKAKPTKKKAK